MADTTFEEWVNFLRNAGIRDNIALQYASSFFQNRIQLSMVLDLNRDVLRELGVSAIGDAIAILKHAKTYHEQSTQLKILKSIASDNNSKNLSGFNNRLTSALDTAPISINIKRNEGDSSSYGMSTTSGHSHSNPAVVSGNNFTFIKEDLSEVRQNEEPLPSTLLGHHDKSSEKYNTATMFQTNTNQNSAHTGYSPREERLITSPRDNFHHELSLNSVQRRDAIEHPDDTHLVSRSQGYVQQFSSDVSRQSLKSTKHENTSLASISTSNNIGNQSLGMRMPIQQQSHVTNVSSRQQFVPKPIKRTHSNETITQSSNFNLENNGTHNVRAENFENGKRFAISPQGITQEQASNDTNAYEPSLNAENCKTLRYKSGNSTTVQSSRGQMRASFIADSSSYEQSDLSGLKNGSFVVNKKTDKQTILPQQSTLNTQRRQQTQRVLQMQKLSSSHLNQGISKSHSRMQAESQAQILLPRKSQLRIQHHQALVDENESALLQPLSFEDAHLQEDTEVIQSHDQNLTVEDNQALNFTVKINESGIRKIGKNTVTEKNQTNAAVFNSKSPRRNSQSGGVRQHVVTTSFPDYHSSGLVSRNVDRRMQNDLKTKPTMARNESLGEVTENINLQTNRSSMDWEECYDAPETFDSDSGDTSIQIYNTVDMALQHKAMNNAQQNRVPGQIFSRLGMKVKSPSPSSNIKKIPIKNNALVGSQKQRLVKVNQKKLKLVNRVQSGAPHRILSKPQNTLKPRSILKPKSADSGLQQEKPQRMTANLLLESVARTSENMDKDSDVQVNNFDEDSIGCNLSEPEEENFDAQFSDDNSNPVDGEFCEIPVSPASGSKSVRFGSVCVKEFKKNNSPTSSTVNSRHFAFRNIHPRQKKIWS